MLENMAKCSSKGGVPGLSGSDTVQSTPSQTSMGTRESLVDEKFKEAFDLKKLLTMKQNIKELSPSQAVETCQDILDVFEDFVASQYGGDDVSLYDDISDCLLKCKFKPKNKTVDLTQMVRREVINQLPGFVTVMDTDSHFVNLNDAQVNMMGYKDMSQVQGLSYDAFRSEASELCEVFKKQDQRALKNNQSVHYLSYNQYPDSAWHLLLGEISCLHDDNGDAVGLLGHAKDVTKFGLVDISRFLIDEQKRFHGKLKRNSFTYYIMYEDDENNISKKEVEVLFFLLRGKTTREIAEILFRSNRTIDFHLEAIKGKFNVTSKSELIEKAIHMGYMNILPETLVK